jgi:hypothetical protein
MLAITDYVFRKYNVEHLKFQGEDTIEIVSFVDVELEEDDDVPEDSSGSRTNNAIIYLTIMGKRLRYVLGIPETSQVCLRYT